MKNLVRKLWLPVLAGIMALAVNCITIPVYMEPQNKEESIESKNKEKRPKLFYQNYGILMGEKYSEDGQVKIQSYDSDGDGNIDKQVYYGFVGFTEDNMAIWEILGEWDDLNRNGEIDEDEITAVNNLAA